MRIYSIMSLLGVLLWICPNYVPAYQAKQGSAAGIDELREAANRGDAESQCKLAKTYLGKNNGEAVKWFNRAADQGLAEAQSWMGTFYDAGVGVELDYKKAVQWFSRAAEQGDVLAQVNLGFMYDQGRNEPLQMPAMNGAPYALLNPGNRGGVVLRDYVEAAKWYGRAAEQGNDFAQASLGWMYLEGRGVRQDKARAAGWFRKAAEQGDVPAQCMLGAIYAEGKDVPQDIVQSNVWLSLCVASTQGQRRDSATKLRDEIANHMSPRQLEDARKIATEYDFRYEPISGQAPFAAGERGTPPIILIEIKPPYTEQARRERAEGIVVTQCVVRKNGTVGRCRILRELGYGLDETAVRTMAARWRFKPGTRQGEPVDVSVFIEVSFRLY